ncbi:MAG: MBOAT family protein [Clostridia bacterium]|nr:MBOAT family protein [Clostridia bacterium]
MRFTSYEFLGFLVLLFPLYYLVPKKWQWGVLLAASYLFYAFAGWDCILFILLTTLSSYGVACWIGWRASAEETYLACHREEMDKERRKAYKAKEKKRRFHILLLGLVFNFGILAVLKYTGFAMSGFNQILNVIGQGTLEIPDLLLPMGISFYTFQTMGYLIDVYRAKTKVERNPARLALFTAFFPQLVQGPISRHSDLAEQLYMPHSFDRKEFIFGLQRILWGYFKKLVIADRILIAMKTLLADPEEYRGGYVVMLILLYSVEIYADFTGGIDITIGIAQALGMKLRENFNRPFSSHSTKEYWNRWHITMGSWFTDYVFYPLSVCKPMMKLSKWSRAHLGNSLGKRVPVYLATTVTWFLTGLWHGAGANFIVWGLLNCLVILVSQELEPLYARFRRRFPNLSSSNGYGKFMAVRTFLLMGLIRSLDCYRNVGTTFRLWGSMLTVWNWGELPKGMLRLGLGVADYVIILGGCLIMASVSVMSAKRGLRERLYQHPVLSWVLCGGLLIAVLLLGAYGIGYDASQFIYDQF